MHSVSSQADEAARPRVAVPEPTSSHAEYNRRCLVQYVAALEEAGLEAVPVPLATAPAAVAGLLRGCQGVLLPGSPADVDPARYGEQRHSRTAAADPARAAVDEVMLQEAFGMRKPLLAICYGLQSLNVWRNGTLVQHLETGLNHTNRETDRAHPVRLAAGSMLAEIAAASGEAAPGTGDAEIWVNSSHHQALAVPGDNLGVAARAQEGTIEAVELGSPRHWVLGLQWHPERTVAGSAFSREIFAAFAAAVRAWAARPEENEGRGGGLERG